MNLRVLPFVALVAAAPALAAPDTPLKSSISPGAPVMTPPPDRVVDLAYGAYQRGYYITAFREATNRLERNAKDAAAMTLLGELYNQGLGVRENAKEAASWYGLAARQGDRSALATLGLMAIDGRGMERDTVKAREWLEKAATAGEPTAAYNLGRLLISGGAEADLARGAQLMKVAAEAELGDAQYALGVLYARGRGVPRNPEEAARLYLRAARNGSIAGRVEYAIAQFNGIGVAKSEGEAARHFQHAALAGNAIAQNRIARLYANGRGVPKNLVEAAAWNLVAAAQGLTDSWLDDQARALTVPERVRAEQLAAQRLGRN